MVPDVPNQVVKLAAIDDGVAAQTLRAGVTQLQGELGIAPEFPAEVLAAAEQAAKAPKLPDLDRTDLPFVTIDPPESMDLDQAMHIVRDGDFYRLKI